MCLGDFLGDLLARLDASLQCIQGLLAESTDFPGATLRFQEGDRDLLSCLGFTACRIPRRRLEDLLQYGDDRFVLVRGLLCLLLCDLILRLDLLPRLLLCLRLRERLL